MPHDCRRYFMEVRNEAAQGAMPANDRDVRRRVALDFVAQLRDWLSENRLDQKVSTLDVTSFGYIHITCEPDLIDRVRDQDQFPVTAIRQAANFSAVKNNLYASAR